MAPAPTMSSVLASSRAKCLVPSAESAAVFQKVSAVPSRQAKGRPSSAPNRI